MAVTALAGVAARPTADNARITAPAMLLRRPLRDTIVSSPHAPTDGESPDPPEWQLTGNRAVLQRRAATGAEKIESPASVLLSAGIETLAVEDDTLRRFS